MNTSTTSQSAAGSTSRAGTIRFPLLESDVRAAINNADEIGMYPTWAAQLTGRQVAELVDAAMASLQTDGILQEALGKAAVRSFRSATSSQYHEDARRVNPRYGYAIYGPFSETLSDGTEGCRWRVLWRTYGPTRWIEDDDVRALARFDDKARWDELREGAILRGKAAQLTR